MSPRATLGRLHAKKEFRKVLRARRAENRLLAARACQREPGGAPGLRLAIVLPRRFATAVVRNRLRRRIREACRLAGDKPAVRLAGQPAVSVAGKQGGWDLVLLPRERCLEAKYGEICASVGDILRRFGICPG